MTAINLMFSSMLFLVYNLDHEGFAPERASGLRRRL